MKHILINKPTFMVGKWNTMGRHIDMLQYFLKITNNDIAIHLKSKHIQTSFVVITIHW
jgi:hypothetical protein